MVSNSLVRACDDRAMIKFETDDLTEVRRCKRAQFHGRIASVTSNGSTATGVVYSVSEASDVFPKGWIVTIDPKSFPLEFAPKKRRSF
jgi:hypothetical protein